jgi:MFS superfamily sulfate permease-like transporter
MPIVIYGATVAGIVCIDLLAGVVIGLALTIAKLLWKASRLEIRVFPDVNQERDDLYLEGVASFLRLPQLSSALESIPANRCVYLHIERLYYIDHTCLDLLKAIAAQRSERGGKLEVQWERLIERHHMRHLDVPASRVAA